MRLYTRDDRGRKKSGTATGGRILNTAMVRKIDDLGRIVIPAETRRLFNIREGDQLAISVDGDSIMIRKLDATCVFCGSTEEVSDFKGRGVCASCRSSLNS